MRADEDRFADMLDAAEAMMRFTAAKSREDLADEVLFWALVAQMTILGESASRVTESARKTHSDVPWGAIVGMRNQLVHGYWSIDPDELWVTIQRDIPALVHVLTGGVVAERRRRLPHLDAESLKRDVDAVVDPEL